MDPVSRAQTGQESPGLRAVARGYGVATRWRKGQTGNPKGRPKKLQITRIFEKILSKPANRRQIQESLMKILVKGGMAPVLLLREMAERTEGKVAQEISVDGSLTLSLAETVAKRRQLIDEDGVIDMELANSADSPDRQS
jgi:hypothetical protein